MYPAARIRFVSVLLACVAAGLLHAANLPPDFVLQTIAGGFTSPVGVAWAPDGRMFVTEKQGKVWIVANGVKLTTPFIDVLDEVNNAGDRGLLGLAFDPNFATNQFVYLLFAVDPTFGPPDESGDSITFGRLARYKANGNVADLSTRTVLLGSGASNGFIHCTSSHAIGTVRFGLDGSLFVGAGDGAHFDFTDGGQNVTTFDPGCEAMFGAANDVGALRSQYRTMMAGKIFRIDPATGLGLSDNPFFDGNPASVASRVWVSGLRNPFRFTVRPNTPGAGTLYIGDVGLGTWEELNCSPGGGENFGWPCYEGVGTQPSYQSQGNTATYCNALSSNAVSAPLLTWNHSTPGTLGFTGNCVAGVTFYTGSSYPIKYRNACFFQDYGQSWLRVAFVNNQNQVVSIEPFGNTLDSPVDLQTEPGTGDLVYVAIFSGEVRRIRYTLSNSPPTVVATATPSAGPIPLDVQFSSNGTTDPNGDALTLTWSFGDGTPNSTLANPLHRYTTIGTFTATLTASDGRGGVSSKSLAIETRNTPPTASITSPVDGYRFSSGEFVTLQATATDREDGTNLAYSWEVRVIHNNHIHPEYFVSNSKTPPPVQLEGHGTSGDRYSYQVILIVTDSGGLTATDSVVLVPVEITVNGPPVARFTTTPPSGNAPLLVNFDASSSSDPDGDLILNYTWDFGDGSTGTGSVISHIYEVQGNYTARLTTEDMLHASSTAQAIIPVQTSGLKGEYFDNIDFTNLKLTRVDPTINFDWGTGSPDAAIAVDTFSIRWTGRVVPKYSELYTFYTITDNGVRLWVNGQLIIDKWIDQSLTEWPGSIALNAGVKYDLKLEFYENSGGAVAKLLWSSPSQPKGIIPAGSLITPALPNVAPVASAGPDLIVSAGEEAHLEGTASDDGLPSPPGQLSFLWTQLDGPAAASILGPTALHTHIEFAVAGSYTFRLLASDGALSAQDNVVVTVTPASGGGGPPWWNAAWSSRRKLTFQNASSAENLLNFPVLVVLDSSRVNYSLLQNAGQDLRFIDADGSTLLSYEIESFNKAGSSFVWVKVPKIDAASSSDFIWLYYGNPSAPAGENRAAAWDSSFSAVWHLRESPAATAPQARDSTSFANHATSSGAMTAAQQLSGRVNGSIRFDGVDDYLQAVDSPSLRLNSAGTLEAWIKANSNANYDRVIAKDRSTGSDAFVISLVPGANRLQVAYAGYRPDGLYTQQGSFTLGAWYHVVCAFNTTSLDVYINGVPQAGLTNSGGVNFGGSPNLRLASRGDGIQKLNGQLDEVRISSSKRSPAWIAANYKAQTATFVAFGAAEGAGGGEEAAAPTAGLFRRGDLNRDGAVDLSDGVALLHHLYSGGAVPICPDAADANDDGAIDVADPITILGFLFQGGAAPPAPGVRDCGIDPTEDFLADCAASDC